MKKQDRSDLENLMRISGVRSEADMRRLFGTGWKTIIEPKRKWVRYMLTVWGDYLGGEDAPQGAVNVIGRLMMRTEWSEDKSRQIEKTVTSLHCQGYRGDELMRKARDIFIPKSAAGNIIALAKESDDAAFMERVMVTTFGRGNPIRSVARLRYCNRNSAQNLIRYLVSKGLTAKEARNRMEWSENILEAELFYSCKREMEKEILLVA
jgi:hypothetical protein